MPVLSQFQPAIDELNAAAQSIGQVVSDLKSQVINAPSAEDINDTLAAVQAGADAVKAAVAQ